jgi:hypothetical protein
MVECPICFMECEENKLYRLKACGHLFHKECIFEHFEISIMEKRLPILCPNEKCQREKEDVRQEDIKEIVG